MALLAVLWSRIRCLLGYHAPDPIARLSIVGITLHRCPRCGEHWAES